MFNTVDELLARIDGNGSASFDTMNDFLQCLHDFEELQGENAMRVSVFLCK